MWVKRQLTSPDAPVTFFTAAPTSRCTASYSAGNRSQVQAVSNVSLITLIRASPSRM